MTDIGQVTFTNAAGQSLTAWVNGVAKETAGQFGGYGSVAKTARRAGTVYGGVDVVGMVIPILLDAWADQLAVSTDVRLLRSMGSPTGVSDRTPPSPIFITGSVPFPGGPRPGLLGWVIQTLEPGDTILLREGDGVALRRDWIVTVLEAPVDAVLVTNGKRYLVQKGDTLTSIAARQLGKASRWREILDATGQKIRDPKSVKPGQHVRLP